MQIITVLSQVMDMARRKFTRGEQSMLIDIFNGTILTPGILGQHLTAEVEDSFNLYPGVYEEKWGVDQKEMVDKIISLDPLTAAFLELWVVGFWAVNISESSQLEDYLSGKLNLSVRIEDIIQQLQKVCDKLEQTKSAFKSASVAESRTQTEKAAYTLRLML